MVTLSYSAYEGMANHQLLPLGTSWSLFRDLNENSGVVLLVQRQDLDSLYSGIFPLDPASLWTRTLGTAKIRTPRVVFFFSMIYRLPYPLKNLEGISQLDDHPHEPYLGGSQRSL